MSKSQPMPDQTARRALLWSLGFGLLSAALAGWLLQRYEREVSGGDRVYVLRAFKPIERGSTLSDELLVAESVPASYVEARAVHATDLAKIRGVRTATALDPQDTLLWTDLAVSQERRDLSALIQPGSRAVTLHAPLAGAEPGTLVRPGDYVDILASLAPSDAAYADRTQKLVSVLLLQRILVLAVGPVTDPQAVRGELEGAALTLSLKVEEAQLLALAQERGKLSVLLRQPDDSRIYDAAPELPVSNLFDSAFRNELQRRRSSEPRPLRLTSTAVSP